MDILLSGSVAYDYLMTFPGYFRDHFLPDHLESISLSFLVDSMVRMRGGVAPNIAYTLALFGSNPRLWATVGEDFEEYRRWLEKKGVDTSGARVIQGEYTASFFVNTDRAQAQIASFYPGAMSHAAEISLHELSDNLPDLVVVSPNDPKAMDLVPKECRELGIPYIYDPSQQICRLTKKELLRNIPAAFAVFINEYEASLIHKMTHWAPLNILEQNPDIFIVVTRGVKGSRIYTNQEILDIPPASPEKIVDPTGVGDAYRGGFLTGLSIGMDYSICGRMGALAATYCIEDHGTQGHTFTPEQFIARYFENYGEQKKLEVLLDKKTIGGDK